jgi:deazaflavin-dependent oxidoreductase (nitroreductase family)
VLYGKEHVKRYEATDGEEGHIWEKGSTVGILTTTGRKSGEPRKTPLIYGKHGDDPIVIASNGGTDEPPSWYQNLQASPEAEFQILGDRFKVRPRDANPEEKPDLWKQMTDQWPDYDEYQKLTDREIPVVILERA